MAERSVAIRVAVRDVEEARRRLASLGASGEAALEQIERGGRQARAALVDLDDAAVRTGRGLRGGLGIQNIAFQVGDFATQVAAGTSAMRAFALQAPQAFVGFGPQGAIIGAAIAGVGALAAAFFDMGDGLDDAEAATKRFEDAQDALKGLMGNVTEEVHKQAAEIAALSGAVRQFAEDAFADLIPLTEANLAQQHASLRQTLAEVERTILESGETMRGGLGLDIVTLTTTARLLDPTDIGNRRVVELANQVRDLARETGDPRLQEYATTLTQIGGTAATTQERLDELRDSVERLNAGIAGDTGGGGGTGGGGSGGADDAQRFKERISRLATEAKLLEGMKADVQAMEAELDQQEAAAAQEAAQAAAEQRRQIEREAAENQRLLEEPLLQFIRSAQNSLAGFFESIYSGGVESFSDLFEEAKRLAIRFAAELSALAVFRPDVVFGATGAGGASGGGLFGGFGGFGNALNQFGGQLGFSVPAASGVGPPTAGFLGTTASFSSVLGAAGAGAVGGGLVGGMFGGQGALGGSIGGAGGAAAGALIGSAIPGVGTAIGALIGGLIGTAAGGGIGSLFGGSERNTGVISGGLGNVSAQGSGDLDAVAAVVAGVDEAITDLLNIRQRQIVDQALRGTQIRTDFNSFDQNVGNFVAGERVRDIARALGFDASNIAPGSATADQAVQNLATALEVQRAIEDITGSVSAFDRQVEDATLRFEDLEDKARRFGISIEGLAEAQEDAIDDLRKAQDARLAALSEPFEQLLDPLRDFREALGFSGLNPQQQFDLAQEEFRRIAEEAAAGSTEAIEQLAGAGQIFIQAADVFGASPAAAAARDEVLARLDATIGRVEDARDEANRDIVAEIQRHRIEEIDTLRELVDLTRELINEVKRTGRASI